MTTAQDRQSRAEADQWKCGNEFLPYHPSASHVEPAYRDGWNACFKAATQVQAMARVPVEIVLNSFESAVSAYTGYIQRGGSPLDAEANRLRSIKDDMRASVVNAPRPPGAQEGELVITTDEAGAIVAVTRQDDECRILSVLAEPEVRSKPLTDEQIEQATGAKRGHPLFLVAKGFTIAVEAAHGITHPTGD